MAKRTHFLWFSVLFLTVSCAQKVVKTSSEKPLEAPSHLKLSMALRDQVLGYQVLQDQKSEGVEADVAKLVSALNDGVKEDVALHRACTENSQSLFCALVPDPHAKHRRHLASLSKEKTPNVWEVKKKFRSLDVFDYSEMPFSKALGASRSFSLKDNRKLGEKLIADNRCAASAFYAAIASNLEDHFPDKENFDLARQLYQRALTCGKDSSAISSAYRGGMLSVFGQDCQDASVFLEKVNSSNDFKFLHSRSSYWILKCGSGNEAVLKKQGSVYEKFPLSYHGVLELVEKKTDLQKLIQGNADPGVLFRTGKQAEINRSILYSELLIKDGQTGIAKRLLRKINVEQLKETEEGFLIYLGYLFNRLEMGVESFQSLAQALSRNSTLKSTDAMKLFYPKWHYDVVEKYAKLNNLNPFLVMSLVRQESAFSASALSPANARGLMQLIPSTARIFDRHVTKQKLFDPETNVRLGTLYLSKLIQRFNGNITLALAAYNAGPRAVDSWMQRYPTQDKVIFMDLIPYRETREYVGSILRNWQWYEALYAGNQAYVQKNHLFANHDRRP